MPALSEASMQRTIIEAGQWYGFRVAHFRPAQTARGWRTPVEGDAGFPDVVLALHGLAYAFELKSERGKLSPEQLAWGDELRGPNGVSVLEYGVVRPSQLDDVLALLERSAAARRR